MIQQVFINLPVKSLGRSVEFFTKLGFTFDPRFTDENATCLIIGENTFAMLLLEKFFKTFTPGKLCDAAKGTEVIVAISLESRAEVDQLMEKALAAGATEPRPPQDYEFMYGRDFLDPDGHIWEPFYMDMETYAAARGV